MTHIIKVINTADGSPIMQHLVRSICLHHISSSHYSHDFVHFVHERVVQVVHWCNRRPSPLSPSRSTQKNSFWWANYFLQNSDARRRAEKCMVCTTNCLPPNCIIQKWQHSKFEEKMEGQKLDQSDWAQKMLSLSLSLSLAFSCSTCSQI